MLQATSLFTPHSCHFYVRIRSVLSVALESLIHFAINLIAGTSKFSAIKIARVMARMLLWLASLLTFCKASDVMKFQVFEEQEAETFVGDISESSAVKAMATDDNIKGELRYEFKRSLQTSFGIDETTGVIRTAAKIDRENVSLGRIHDTFKIWVQASTGVMTEAIPTEIKILDINDNSPIFKEDIENISVKESAPIGAELPITVAEDSDIGNNSVQSYEIVDGNDGGMFHLNVLRPTSETFQVKLVVSKWLDREINDSYHLVIEAKDGGSPPRVGRKGLSVTVLDSNDHFPKFSKDLYVGEVRENSRVGTFVLNVTANDKDIGTNGEVVYSLQVPPQYKHLFTLDARTGELRTSAALDYELSKDYHLQVTARDEGLDSIPSTAVVNVKVSVQYLHRV